MISTIHRLACMILFLHVIHATSQAQKSVWVQVKDNTGAAIAGARVEVKNEQNPSLQFTVFTDAMGWANFVGVSTGVQNEAIRPPHDFLLLESFPNPFTSSATILFYLPNIAEVHASVYNILGQRVANLGVRQLDKGWHTIAWDGRSDQGAQLSAGLYFAVVEANGKKQAKKMLRIDQKTGNQFIAPPSSAGAFFLQKSTQPPVDTYHIVISDTLATYRFVKLNTSGLRLQDTLRFVVKTMTRISTDPSDQENAIISKSGTSPSTVQSDPATAGLWGASGENWETYLGVRGRLPDYSYAGYHSGEQPIPDIPIVKDVKVHYGAKGDGVTDDTKAFENALSKMPAGALNVPPGTYVLSKVLYVKRSNIVIRGNGTGDNGTKLYFTKDLHTVLGYQDRWRNGLGGLLWIGSSSWSYNWKGTFRADVAQEATRGDTILKLSSVTSINAGDVVVLEIQNNAQFMTHLHNGQSTTGFEDFLNLEWPVKVLSKDPAQKTIQLAQPLRFNIFLSTSPKIYKFVPAVVESGAENLAIAFPEKKREDHYGPNAYNGIFFHNTFNCWARDIVISNDDNGVSIRRAKNNTIFNLIFNGRPEFGTGGSLQGVKLWFEGPRDIAPGTSGHHGVTFNHNAHDNLLDNFTFNVLYGHDITVIHLPSGNVSKNGVLRDAALDHHHNAPFENLFSNLNIGVGTPGRLYESGGGNSAYSDSESGARETFWNLKTSNAGLVPVPPWFDIQQNVIPANVTQTAPPPDGGAGGWAEMIPNLIPVDLHQSQLDRRLGGQ